MQMPSAIVGRRWEDESGRSLRIHRCWLPWPVSRWGATFREKDFSPRSLKALARASRMSRLPVRWTDDKLMIELGYPGVGPYLELSVEWNEQGEPLRLIPRVCTGLYDDWEQDFGVPWIFPLSPYELQAQRGLGRAPPDA
jgi:hypothetical protein